MPESQKPSQRLDARLLLGLSAKEKEEFGERWASSRHIREVIASHLTKQLTSVIIESEGSELLAHPNALAKLADLHAQRRVLRSVIKLISDKDPE